ncbi:MAG: glycoside hydrolase family 32 protein [Kiritimatiellaeota bacterium]|nr:glycoside hydrolase family 32 protein [Kiritimatiellota bacterium]
MNKLTTFILAALLLAPSAKLYAAEAAAPALATRTLKLDKQFLLLPIGTAPNPDYHMTITVGDEKIHDFFIDLGVDKVGWWTHIDVSQWAGKTATLTIDKPQETAAGFERIETADAPRNLHPLYDETMRPQLRFSQQRGWNNDPNGLVYHDGEYHLFWQSNPFAWKWKNMYWGHAVSTDLIHWKELPHALRPRAMGNTGECFSGSGNIDEKNTGGWQTGKEQVMVLAYTDTGRGECIAISRDRGRTWESIQENPVIKHPGRDPKLIWYAYDAKDTPLNDRAKELGGHWVIVVFDEANEHGRNFTFHTSTDLKEWTLQSRMKGYFECPELFELPVDGDKNNTRWIVFDVHAQYAVGSFDGRTFTPEHDGRRQVHWPRFVASQCFSRAPGGRVIQVAWAHAIETHGMPFNQVFALPGELTLVNTPDGVRMRHWPIKELESLRQPPITAKPGTIAPDQSLSIKVDSQLFDIIAEVEPKGARQIILQIGATKVAYDVGKAILDTMTLPLTDGILRLRVISDRPIYELWGGAGEVHRSNYREDRGRPISDIRLIAEGGEAVVKSFTVYPMKSIWKL